MMKGLRVHCALLGLAATPLMAGEARVPAAYVLDAGGKVAMSFGYPGRPYA